MKNPWSSFIPSLNDNILEMDKEIITPHNDKYKNHYQVSLKDFPEPFLGNKNANIYLLLANPGRNRKKEETNISLVKDNTELEKIVSNNLKHEFPTTEYPFYFLDERFKNHTGFDWWNKAFKSIIDKDEAKRKSIANNVFGVELYGYHTESFASRLVMNRERLLSIDYTKKLVQNAIDDNKIIIICRAIACWLELVPNLKEYKNCFFLSKNRNIVFSGYTMSPGLYMEFQKELNK